MTVVADTVEEEATIMVVGIAEDTGAAATEGVAVELPSEARSSGWVLGR